jgi:hypothetical protein
MPTLNEIVAKLSSRGMGASVGNIVGGVALFVSAPGEQHKARGYEHPQLHVVATVGPNHVLLKHSGVGSKQHTYKVEQVTKALIEQHALELIRSVYRS